MDIYVIKQIFSIGLVSERYEAAKILRESVIIGDDNLYCVWDITN
jgi:hypothetical protein